MYKENFIQTANVSSKKIVPKGVVVHHISLNEGDTVDILTMPKGVLSDGREFNGVSAHCIIWKDGSRTKLAEDTARTWHAGKSEFKGISGCNNFMLGVEFHGDTNVEPLTQDQIGSFIEWLIPRIEDHKITLDWITDHRTIAPDRKVDINPVELERLLTAIKPLFTNNK